MPLEGAKGGVQIGATHSLSEPGTFALALGFSLNVITWVSTTVSSEQPRASQEAWERTGFSRSAWPFLLFKTATLNEPAGETGPACPGSAAQRCPGAGRSSLCRHPRLPPFLESALAAAVVGVSA